MRGSWRRGHSCYQLPSSINHSLFSEWLSVQPLLLFIFPSTELISLPDLLFIFVPIISSFLAYEPYSLLAFVWLHSLLCLPFCFSLPPSSSCLSAALLRSSGRKASQPALLGNPLSHGQPYILCLLLLHSSATQTLYCSSDWADPREEWA